MAGTRRLTVVTAFTVTGLLFSGGALKAFADDHGGGDRGGGDKHDKQRQVERAQPQVQVAAPRAEHEDVDHGRNAPAQQPAMVNVAAPQQSVSRGDDDHGGGGGDHGRGGGGGDNHGPSVNAGPGNHNDDEDENEHENATPTPTPMATNTPTPTPTGTLTMTPTATPTPTVVPVEQEEDFNTVINGINFECEAVDEGQHKDRGRHLGEEEEDVVTFITVNGVNFICQADVENED